jgi:hypothetical protein
MGVGLREKHRITIHIVLKGSLLGRAQCVLVAKFIKQFNSLNLHDAIVHLIIYGVTFEQTFVMLDSSWDISHFGLSASTKL